MRINLQLLKFITIIIKILILEGEGAGTGEESEQACSELKCNVNNEGMNASIKASRCSCKIGQE